MSVVKIKDTGRINREVYHELGFRTSEIKDGEEGIIRLVSVIYAEGPELAFGHALVASTDDGNKFAILPCPPYCSKPPRVDIVNGNEIQLLSNDSQEENRFRLSEIRSLGDGVCICLLRLGDNSLTFGFIKADIDSTNFRITKGYINDDDKIVLPMEKV